MRALYRAKVTESQPLLRSPTARPSSPGFSALPPTVQCPCWWRTTALPSRPQSSTCSLGRRPRTWKICAVVALDEPPAQGRLQQPCGNRRASQQLIHVSGRPQVPEILQPMGELLGRMRIHCQAHQAHRLRSAPAGPVLGFLGTALSRVACLPLADPRPAVGAHPGELARLPHPPSGQLPT